MTFLPVVERELRVASRKRGTYWTRVGAALGALAIGGWITMFAHFAQPQMVGKTLFTALAVVTMIYAVQTGMRLTTDCLSEEKREGTLGLLFLTDLKGFDVVFGKLVANSLGSFYGMLAVFPVMAISLLLGGVTGVEFARVTLVALNLLFLSLCIGMFASAVCRDERRSLALASAILTFFAGFGPLLYLLVSFKTDVKEWEAFCLPSPVYGAWLAFSANITGHVQEFWMSTAITNLYAWLLLFLACRIVPRSWQDKPGISMATKLGRLFRRVSKGDASAVGTANDEDVRFRRRLLEINSFYWLAARDRFKAYAVWGFLGCVALIWIVGIFYAKKDWFNPGVYIITALGAHLILKVWISGEACRRFVDDRRNGAMEWLLCTPLTVADILHGQRLALLRQFGGPTIAVVVMDLLMMFAGFQDTEMRGDKTWLLVFAAGISIFVMDMLTLSWLGMWTGLTAQKTNRAAGAAITRILFLPWLAFGIAMSGLGMLSIMPLTRQLVDKFNITPNRVIIFWFVLGVVNNLFWMYWSKRGLQSRFRELAIQRLSTTSRFNWFRSAASDVK